MEEKSMVGPHPAITAQPSLYLQLQVVTLGQRALHGLLTFLKRSKCPASIRGSDPNHQAFRAVLEFLTRALSDVSLPFTDFSATTHHQLRSLITLD